MQIIPSGQTLGARIQDLDLARPLTDPDFRAVLRALGEHGVLCFPNQNFGVPDFAAFARRFGELEINVANQFHEPGFPEIMVLSNMKDAAGRLAPSLATYLANDARCQRLPWLFTGPLDSATQWRNHVPNEPHTMRRTTRDYRRLAA
jgi:hypothetical protein